MNPPEPGDGDVPVLTQIVADLAAPPPAQEAPAAPVDEAAFDALADQLEHALLERLGPEIDRATARALNGVRAELTVSVMRIVRESVAAAVAQTLRVPKRD